MMVSLQRDRLQASRTVSRRSASRSRVNRIACRSMFGSPSLRYPMRSWNSEYGTSPSSSRSPGWRIAFVQRSVRTARGMRGRRMTSSGRASSGASARTRWATASDASSVNKTARVLCIDRDRRRSA
jgi:hypothetical protein